MYRITQEIDFSYGHRLLRYEGKCRHLHGHNGRLQVVLAGDRLDERGMLVDFGDVKKQVRRWIEKHLDHRMILCADDPVLPALQELQEAVYVMPENPTAENIARLIFEQLTKEGLPVSEVILWETTRSAAAYRGTEG